MQMLKNYPREKAKALVQVNILGETIEDDSEDSDSLFQSFEYPASQVSSERIIISKMGKQITNERSNIIY